MATLTILLITVLLAIGGHAIFVEVLRVSLLAMLVLPMAGALTNALDIRGVVDHGNRRHPA